MSFYDNYPLTDTVREFLAQQPIKLLINGKWVPANSGKTLPVFDPSSGEIIAQVAAGDAADIDKAVAAARAALPAWKAVSPGERAEIIWRLSYLIERDAEHLAQLDTVSNGLPLDKTLNNEIPAVLDDLRYYAGWTTKLCGRTIPVSIPGFSVHTKIEPMGVCGAITPWNYPLEAFSGKVGPSLCCGNTLVLKPSEESPLSALWLGKLCLEAGIPSGVLNIIPGHGHEAGAALAEHMDVDKIGFTGSTAVGRKLINASAGNIKRLSLELGGKSPNVIFADADMDKAIEDSTWAIFGHSGQNCIAGSRLFVERSVYDLVVQRVAERAATIKIGSAFDPETEVGPVISAKQHKTVSDYIQKGIDEGATLRYGGGRPEGVPDGGYYIEPTIFIDVTDDMSIVKEEIFGPVLCILPFDSFDEMIARANDSDYGLASSIWTRDIVKAERFSHQIETGIVWVNGHALYDAPAPFGGYKQSGYGRDLGEASLQEYTKVKTVWVGNEE